MRVYRRIYWTVTFIPLAFMIGTGLLFYYRGTHPGGMGVRAPMFGSSPKMSSPEGFVVGTWLMRHDDAGKSLAHEFFRLSEGASPTRLRFEPNGGFSLSMLGSVGHGTWQSDGQVFNLAAVEVDGISPAEVDEAYERYVNLPVRSLERRANGAVSVRHTCLQAMRIMARIAIADDRKRLMTVREHESMFGTEFWVRES